MSDEHIPLEVTSVEGWPMVRCSCGDDDPRNTRWQSAYWLSDHWQGSKEDGVVALTAVVEQQARDASEVQR